MSTTVAAVHDTPSELARLWSLGWPVALGGVGMLAMSAVDTAMVGSLGTAALAALQASSMWIHALGVLGRGVVMGVDPIVTQAHGRGDAGAIGGALRAAMATALLVSVPIIAAYWVAEPVLSVLGQPTEILPDVARYCRAVGWGVPAMMLFWAIRQVLQGEGTMRPATVAIVVANGLNVVLNACLVHGWLGAPALGVVGAGYATAGSSWCMVVVLAWLTRRDLARMLGPTVSESLASGVLAVLRPGVPIAVQLGVEVWGFIAAGVIIGWLGTQALAGHAVAMLVASLAFMVPLGISSGATTRVGNLLGAGLPWRRSGWLAMAMGALITVLAGAVMFFLPEHLSRLFTDDVDAIAVAAVLLPIAGTFQVVDGLQVTAHGVLRGVGDVKWPMLFNLVAHWGVGLPLGYLMGIHLGWGPQGVWYGLVAALGLVSVMLLVRLLWHTDPQAAE